MSNHARRQPAVLAERHESPASIITKRNGSGKKD